MVRIPFISNALEGWQLAARGFADKNKSKRRKQQWKSFFGALVNPQFASKWFATLKSPELLFVTKHRPQLYLKPFRVYVSTRWKKKQKVKVILDTYRFILGKGEAFREVITSNNIELTRFKLNDDTEGIFTLGYDDRYRKEGELVLSFECKQLGGTIVAAAFSFEEMEPGQWVCWIGCVQGHMKNAENASKEAQKLLQGLRPKALIVFIVQEFSRHFGCTAVYGTGDAIQTYRKKHAIHLHWRHAIQFDYDAIWTEYGGVPDKEGWFKLPIVPVRKNSDEIKPHKRALYRRRYALLDDLSLKIADAVKRLSA